MNKKLNVFLLLIKTAIYFAFFAIPLYLGYVYFFVFYDADHLKVNESKRKSVEHTCEKIEKQGGAVQSHKLITSSGIHFRLNTPSNYLSSSAYPVVIVFSPAMGGSFSERFTGLTSESTENGFMVAYVESRRLSVESILKMHEVITLIDSQWCVDRQRIYFTGHSDGGTISQALAILPESEVKPRAIAPSAAGFRYQDLEAYECPQPTSIMLMHNRDDTHFEGYGRDAIRWWSDCNQCSKTPVNIGEGCEQYSACKNGVETIYCEGSGGHLSWPKRNGSMLQFFLRN